METQNDIEEEFSKDSLRSEAFNYLRKTVNEIFQNQKKNYQLDRIAISSLNYQLALALSRTLNDEKETTLNIQLERKHKTEEILLFHQNELRKERQIAEEQIKAAHVNNEQMKEDFQKLESIVRRAKDGQKQRDKMYQKGVLRNSAVIKRTAAEIKEHQSLMQQLLLNDLNNVQNDFLQTQQKYKNVFRETRQNCIRTINSLLQGYGQNLMRNSKNLNQFKLEIERKKRDLKNEEEKYRKAINVLNSQLGMNLPTTYDPSSIAFIKQQIEDALYAKTQKEVEKVRREIQREMPNIVLNGNNWQQAVDDYIKKNIEQKEIECQKILKRSAKREQKLKQKLDEVLQDLHSLQTSKINSSKILSELNAMNNGNQYQSTLDQKMSLLTQRIGANSSSSPLSSFMQQRDSFFDI